MASAENCYRIETLTLENPMFNKGAIDATYILTMETSQREYRKNIMRARPTSTIHIQYNKGFKNCKKSLCEEKSHYDIADAVNNAFEDAKARGYGNILVLEDDFFFRRDVGKRDADHISDFLIKNKSIFDCYSLGCIPTVAVPVSMHHLRILQFGGAHAMVFSTKMREDYMGRYAEDRCVTGHVDMFYWRKYKVYGYIRPIAYQLFPATENMSNWPLFGRVLIRLMPTIEKRAEPWYSICYVLSVFPALLAVAVIAYAISAMAAAGCKKSIGA